jgi:ABC-2 type transport system permease protein
MSDFWRVFRFEVRRDLARPGLWVGAALFFLLGFGMLMLVAGAGEGAGLSIALGGGETLLLNSPYMNHVLTVAITFFGLILTASLFGAAASYEYTHRMTPLLWTTRLTRGGAWWGRFAAALLVNVAVLSATGFGLWVGSLMPWLDRSLFGHATFMSYAAPYLLTVLPRTFLPAVLVYLLVSKTRSPLAGHLAVVGMIGVFIVSGLILSQVENRTLAALLDPTGNVSWDLVTRTWSTAEKNGQIVSLTGLVLGNRLLWLGVAIALLALGRLTFKPERGALGSAPISAGRLVRELLAGWKEKNPLPDLLRPLTRRLPMTVRLALAEYRSVVLHPGFLISVLLMVFFFFLVILTSGSNLGGTRSWPVTYQVAGVLTGAVAPFTLGLLLFFSGHLVWRERSQRIDALMDVLPRSDWQPLLSKFVALALVTATLQAIAIFLGLLYQTFQGYFRYQLGVYLETFLGFRMVEYLLLLVLALFLQSILPRYAAYFATALLYIGFGSAPAVGLDHVLYLYGSDPGLQFSELNGYRPFLRGWLTTEAYWAAIAGLLFLAAGLFWRRGIETVWARRVGQARRRAGTGIRIAAATLAVAALGLGAWIFFNTNVLNHYERRSTTERRMAEIERKYRPALAEPQPRVADTDLTVDLFPAEGRARFQGSYRLENRTAAPISRFLLSLDPEVLSRPFVFDRPAKVGAADPDSPYRRVDLASPLLPGQALRMSFDLRLARKGFANRTELLGQVIDNGTFLNHAALPGIGYSAGTEIQDPRRRKKLGLPKRDPLPPFDDRQGRANTVISGDSDRMPFHAVVSTSADQVALAPGDLVRQWEKEGRRYFEYRSAVPIFKFYAFVSGRYSVLRDRAAGVDLEIYYHPDHSYNVATMMKAMKATLASIGPRYGAYPQRTLRIVEYPRYAAFAQSYPTLVPFSEDVGWIARRKQPEDIDYPLYITAHEVAHQWWGHRVAAARVQGATFLVETLAQDSALRVMEEQLGRSVMGRFLRYELDRYLAGRSQAVRDEVPILEVQNQQFLHYNKGSLVMYRLADLIGRATLDAALAELSARTGEAGPPYPISLDLYAGIRARTPAALEPTVADMFERMTLYDLETTKAECKPLDKGRYRVSFDVKLDKGYADGTGKLKPAPLDEWIDVAVLAEEKTDQGKVPKPLVLERREMRQKQGHFEFVVNEKPVKAGLDPYFKVVDRQPENNTLRLSCGGLGMFGM